MTDEIFQIGKLALLAKVSVQTIRYYERLKLLTPIHRKSAKGIRYYDQSSLRTLGFIKNAQKYGFQLGEIKTLLKIRAKEDLICHSTQVLASKKLLMIQEEIKKYREVERQLKLLLKKCQTSPDVCPIMASMDSKK